MTKTTRDIPTHEGMTIGDRLKAAREKAGMTRKALYEATGIPSSSLEKYERGELDPQTTRLKAICKELDVPVNWVLNGDETSYVTETSKPAETLDTANVTESFTETLSENMAGDIIALLDELDGLRTTDFEGSRRRAIALVEEALSLMKYLEPDELFEVVAIRGLHEEECPTTDFLVELYEGELEDAQRYCGNIEERIVDTAILGIDLYSVNKKALIKVAKSNGVSAPGDLLDIFESWGDHDKFVPKMRPVFRSLAFTGNAVDFQDEEMFPRREVSVRQDEDDDNEEKSSIGFF